MKVKFGSSYYCSSWACCSLLEAKQPKVSGELETPEKRTRRELWPDLQGPNMQLCVKEKKIKKKTTRNQRTENANRFENNVGACIISVFSPVPELSFLPAPYRGWTRAGERRVQGPVVQRLDNSIHRINHYPVDSVVCFVNTYPLDSDLSGG